MKKERIIVSLTTWSKRIQNIPTVLDTIFAQTLPPDLVVLNLAYDEKIPQFVQDYINQHSIEVNRVPDTKVYKKLIPTLKKYPNDCIISIDDDWLYPNGMIADFMEAHKLYPNNPISGNQIINFDLQCHCGCASLMKKEYIGEYIEMIDNDVISNCPSDDIVYTYFCYKSGHPYFRSKNNYFTNMESYNNNDSYSKGYISNGEISDSYNYLVARFGKLDNFTRYYIKEQYIADYIYDIYKRTELSSFITGQRIGEERIYSTISYKLGNTILKPFSALKKFLFYPKP